MASQQRVSVLLGSQRGANGNAEAVAAWFASRWPPTTEYSLDIVESVTKFSLPPLTGHLIPAAANEQYPDAAVQRWSDHVKGAAAIIIITPQYNWSIPSSLKLALDHLYPEWKAKKVGVITYGGHGGSKVAEHLKVMLPGGAGATRWQLLCRSDNKPLHRPEGRPRAAVGRRNLAEGGHRGPNASFGDRGDKDIRGI
jgi:NAD(P)H-dependent FMN reductase